MRFTLQVGSDDKGTYCHGFGRRNKMNQNTEEWIPYRVTCQAEILSPFGLFGLGSLTLGHPQFWIRGKESLFLLLGLEWVPFW